MQEPARTLLVTYVVTHLSSHVTKNMMVVDYQTSSNCANRQCCTDNNGCGGVVVWYEVQVVLFYTVVGALVVHIIFSHS